MISAPEVTLLKCEVLWGCVLPYQQREVILMLCNKVQEELQVLGVLLGATDAIVQACVDHGNVPVQVLHFAMQHPQRWVCQLIRLVYPDVAHPCVVLHTPTCTIRTPHLRGPPSIHGWHCLLDICRYQESGQHWGGARQCEGTRIWPAKKICSGVTGLVIRCSGKVRRSDEYLVVCADGRLGWSPEAAPVLQPLIEVHQPQVGRCVLQGCSASLLHQELGQEAFN